MGFLNELKRRNVIRVGFTYAVVAWMVAQVADLALASFASPPWVMKTLLFLMAIGWLITLFIAWAYELTPDGIKRARDIDPANSIAQHTGRKLDRLIITVLLLAVGLLLIERFLPDNQAEMDLDSPPPQAIQTTDPPDKEELSLAPDHLKLSIAVLPFVNMSSDPEQEYFSDGITEEILNVLSRIPNLKVAARTSSFQFKGKTLGIAKIAELLKVNHVLEGSVRKSDDTLRITVQLIETKTGFHLWSETYDRKLDDIFAVQDEISGEVVKALKIQLLGKAPSVVLTDTTAYTTYLKGRYYGRFDTPELLRASAEALQEATAIAPEYAPAWAALSNTLLNQANLGFVATDTGMEAARQAVLHALELDRSLADAWSALADLQFVYDWDWDKARRSIQTGLEHDPNNSSVLLTAATISRNLGEFDQAIAYAQKAVELDPLNPLSLRKLGIAYWAADDYTKSTSIYQRILELYPQQLSIRAFVAANLFGIGKHGEAVQYLDIESDNIWQQFISTMVLDKLGRKTEAERQLQRLISVSGEIFAYQIAAIYAQRGDLDLAFDWLERAYKQKDGGLTQLLSDSFLVPLYQDSRWEKILGKMQLLEFWVALQARKSEPIPAPKSVE